MKKIVLLLFALCCQYVSLATSFETFYLDEYQIHTEMQGLFELDAFLDENPGMTWEEVQSIAQFGSLNLHPDAGAQHDASLGGPIGIPSFIWGCCLGVVGILIVYLVEESRQETKKALIGCIVGSILGCGTSIGVSVLTGGVMFTFSF